MIDPAQPYYYTISSNVLVQQYENNGSMPDDSVHLNILMDLPQSSLHVLFKLLNTINNNFIISLPASVALDKDRLKNILPACYLLATFNNFSSTRMTAIPILFENVIDENSDTSILKNYFHEQGIENCHFPLFKYNDSFGIQESEYVSFSVCNQNNITGIEPLFHTINIIAFTPEINNIEAFNQYTTKPGSIKGQENLQNIFIEKTQLEEEIKHWQKRSLLYRQFLQLSKTVQEKEYYEVIDWYHKEYEALPLWYKRFGHIIKVIMGKRSFKSLFSDNVKKYKD